MPDSDVAAGLVSCRECLEQNLGAKVNPSPSNSWSTLSEWHSLDMRNRENWEEGIDWLRERRIIVLEAFNKCLSDLNAS